MKRNAISIVLVSALLIPIQFSASAAIKAGGNCINLGQTTVVSGKKYTCIKSGKKTIWDKGIIYKTAEFAEDLSESERNFCDLDPSTPAEWSDVQKATNDVFRCLPPFRYLPGKNISYAPKTALSEAKDLLNISECKIRDVAGNSEKYGRANFANASHQSGIFTPTKNANILVVGIQFTDVQTSSTPEKDYKRYTDFYAKFLKTSADVDIDISYKFTQNYIQMGKSLEKYGLGDEHQDTSAFKTDFLAVTDPQIDYSNVGQVLIVAPAQTSPRLLSAHMNWYSDWRTSEGQIPSVYLHGPIQPTNPLIDRIWSVSPWITIHEAFGHQLGLDDHLADEEVFAHAKSSSDFRDYGSPNNQMSGAYGDFLAWDKWLSGLISDDQVRCASKEKTTFHWIGPNSTHGKFIKAVLIPLSDGKALEIESFRSTGWNWKFPTFYSGARVQLIDRTETRFGYGVYLLRSDNKAGTRDGTFGKNGKTNLYDAALKLNESLTAYGVKISVIEAGNFGDVIKVEKAA